MDICKAMEMENPDDPDNPIRTGNMLTINNGLENNRTRDHINDMNTVGSTTYFSYAYIGLRKQCTECGFYWEDLEPITYTNWYGSEPNTNSYDCVHIRTASPYFGGWIDMHCGSTYHGVCQFFPSGQPKIEKPSLPAIAGCKNGWWSFGGYCYKAQGFTVRTYITECAKIPEH